MLSVLNKLRDAPNLRGRTAETGKNRNAVWSVDRLGSGISDIYDIKSVIDDTKIMSQPVTSMPLPAERALRKLGRDLALARRKRGDPTVALGTLATATFILNLHDRLANLAAPASDDLGLSLDERRVPQRIRRPKQS